ncbi:protein PRR14L isoform X2 [Notechis scutatus]|uniref:Protein PRR14L isoform X2 n=1 Tax=Notechis scutatus TaxID=8663 RepID=A0A6J1VFK4_9SAUR|nr:protein PRR14L isoform X2 [Notechis scutatus]
MSSAGRELHAAGPGDALPAQRPASASPCASPGTAGERPASTLPPEPHGWTLGACEPPRRPPLAPGEAPRPEEQQQEMRGGGLERPGWCEGGPRLPTCGAKGRPGEKEFQPVQKGREHVASPSCLEMKDLLQNLESPAKVPVASEKQSGLPKEEAPGMKADGSGLCCNAGEPRAQARTGALLEASPCSGGVAVSGSNRLVSPEPLSPASAKEDEEVPASARQTEGEAFQNPGQEMKAVCNSRPSVQQGAFGPPGNPSLALALDVGPRGPRLEGQALQGSSLGRTSWGDCVDLSEAACEVQEGTFKSHPSGGRMEDLGEATELQMAEAPLQAGSPGRELSNNEPKAGDSTDLFSSPVHKGMIRIQKGSAGPSCWKGEGEHFPSKRSMYLSPAEPLVVPKDQDQHSAIGRFSLCDGVQAALEGDLRVSPSEASSIPEDKSSSPRHEKCVTLGQRNGALLSKRHNLGSFQNSCSIKYVSTFLSCWAPQLDFGGNGLPLRVDNLRTAFPLCDLALPQWATGSFCVLADEKSLKVPQLRGPSPFAQKADPGSGHGGPMDSLSPEGVIVMQNPGAWPHHKEAFAPSQASGRLQAGMNEGAWEMVRWVLRRAENGEVAMEAFWGKALRWRVRAVNDLPSAPEEIYALARNLFLDCRHLQESRRGPATKIAFSLGISPALLESGARFVSLPKKFSCSPYRNNWVGLDRAGRPLNSVCPLEVPCSSLSQAEAENWSINGGDAFDGSGSILERKGNILPPYERVEVHKASHGADAGGVKTGNATGCSDARLSLRRAFDGDLSKTPLLCRATFRKGQCLEEQEKYQSHPSSPASNLSHLNRKDSSLCTKCSALRREPIYQMKIFLHPCYSVDSCTLFEQKDDSPKTEFLECQQPSLIFYKKLNYHDLQTVIRSVIKYVRCNKNKSLHSKRELKVTPSATTALLTEYHQGPFHKIITESSNNNTGSEFTGNLPNEDLLESQSPRTLSGSSASESLNRNDFVKKWAPRSKTHDLHSASESIHKRPSGKFNFEKGLLSASKLASSPFQTGPAAASAQIKGQERMKGLLLKSYRKRKILSLLSAGLGSQFPQNKKMCLFPKEAALASPSHGSPLAQRHCRASLPREREAGLESERASSSPGRDAAAACSLLSRRTCQHRKGPRVEAFVSLYPLEQPLEDLEADPREAGRTAGTMEGFPVRILSDTEVSSEALLGNLPLPLRGGKVTFPFKAAIHTGLPLGLPEDFPESDSGKAKDSPEPPVTWRQVESPSCALQAELFLPLKKQAEALGSSVPSSSPSSGLKGGSFAGFPTWPSVKEGRPLRVERGQGLAGGPGEGPEGHLVDEQRRRGDSEAGAQPPAPKEKPPVGRRLALGQPAGSFSGEKAEGPGELARSTWASLGRAGQKRQQQEPPAHMQRESKRQKRGQGCGEPASLNLPFWNRCRQACWPSSVGAFGPFPPAVGCDQSRSPGVFGYLRLQRPFPAFGKLSGAACIKAGMPRRLRAPKPLASKGELVYSAQSATEPAAPQPVLWDLPVKQQGHPSSSLAVSWLAGQPKDAALLTRLSRLAEELMSPACRPFLPRRALLPSAAKWGPRRRRKRGLLEIFSLVSLKLSSPPWLSSCCFKMAGSQALPVYSVESTILCFFELSSDPPCRCSPPGVSPLPFHHQMDVATPGKLPEAGSPSLVPIFPLRGPQPQPPSTRSLFFLLPQGCPDAMLTQKDAEPGSASARKEGEAIACSPACLTPGLPSALALFSPGCYRAWTRRRRHPSSRTPAAQRLSLLHFARGFKGLQDCASVPAGLFSALPSLLGSVLSTWSQQRPSIHLSESTPLHSSPSKGPPALPATASLSHRTSPSLPPLVPGLPSDPSGAVKNDVRLESILSVLLPTSCQGPEPAHPPLGFPALGSGDGHEASVPALPKTGAQLAKDKSENRPKKVSQIRIRKTIPKPDPNLTPMGLPRPKRLKKTEFSLEEIYTNQNYKSPPATRCLETIFEEPKEKNGSLISISQQKRKRILEFQDFTIPRKRRARSRVRVTGGYTRAQKAAVEGRELDVLLIQKLTDLETFFAKEETQEQASSCS